MTKSFYSSAIFLTGIYVALALFQSFIFFRLGVAVYGLPSVAGWSAFMYATTVSWWLLLIAYYRIKDYRVPFYTLAASVAVSLVQFYLFYNLLRTHELTMSYIVASGLLITTAIVHALSLIFSTAGRKKWLKTAGILQLLLGIATLSSFIWALASVSDRVNGSIETLDQWIALFGSLVPLVFIVNFASERAAGQTDRPTSRDTLNDMIRIAAAIIFATAFFIVPKFASEALRSPDDLDNVSAALERIARPFEARVFASSEGDTLPYRLMKPLDYDSTLAYPLVVCLHGSSAVGVDNVKQVAATLPAQLLSRRENRERYPAFLFVPQCPRGFGWGGLPHQPSVDSLVIEAMSALEKEFSIDTMRRYVAGYSMGGYGAWHLISTRPDVFAAAVPICGGGDPAFAREVADVPVWAFHGAKDLNVPVRQTRDMIEAIREAGGNPRYTEFPDAAHDIWAEVTATRELPQWLFAQQRD